MSVFKFPSWAIKALDTIRKKFIWGSTDSGRARMHLLAWERVCLPKAVGGMGLHDLKIHNVSMMIRWLWLLYYKKESLWTTIATALLAKRNNNVPPLLWNQSGSFFWKELQSARYLFQLSTMRVVEDGEATSFWYDNWGGTPLRFLFSNSHNPPRPFVSFKKGMECLNTILPAPRALMDTLVLQGVPPVRNSTTMDSVSWRWSENGMFSVASLYKMMRLAGKVASPITKVWKIRVPPTVRLFMFLMASDRILTQSQLSRRGIHVNPMCVMCNTIMVETPEHLFFQCEVTQQLWADLTGLTGLQVPFALSSVRDSVHQLLSGAHIKSKKAIVVTTACWLIWLERNNRVFRSTARTMTDIAGCVRTMAKDFQRTC